MAATTCPKCGEHTFELALVSPIGSGQKFEVIQCSACGVPIPVLENRKYEVLSAKVSAIDDGLKRIARALTE